MEENVEALVSASDWLKGIGLSITASLIGGVSKLAIRKSWLLIENVPDGRDNKLFMRGDSDVSTLERKVLGCSGINTTCEFPTQYCKDSREISADERQKIGDNQQIHQKSRCLRLSGMFGMTVLNPLCCIFAMMYASPSVLAPLSGLTLVWIILFCEYFVGEKPLPKQIFAAALIIVGEIVVAIMGDHTNDSHRTIMEVAQSYQDPTLIAYFFALVIWMTMLYLAINYGSPTLRRFAWGMSGGSITGLQNFLKDFLIIVKIIQNTNQQQQQKDGYPWFLYAFIICGIASALSGLLLLTACMKRYDATYSSSMFVGSFVISASTMAAAHYGTFQNLLGLWNFIFYPVGLLVLLSGVVLLTLITEDNCDEKKDEDIEKCDDKSRSTASTSESSDNESIDATYHSLS